LQDIKYKIIKMRESQVRTYCTEVLRSIGDPLQ